MCVCVCVFVCMFVCMYNIVCHLQRHPSPRDAGAAVLTGARASFFHIFLFFFLGAGAAVRTGARTSYSQDATKLDALPGLNPKP